VRTAAILPVKRFPAAKTRLGASIAGPARRALASAMAQDVMAVLAGVEALDLLVVVTGEQSAGDFARRLGATVLADAGERGQSSAVEQGIRRAVALGAERVLCVPGDCPALEASELAELLRPSPAPGAGEVVIVPDRHGTGTNALLLTPSLVIAPAFGPDSCERHRRLAAAAGARCRLEHPPSLLLDIDTGADLEALRELLGPEPRRAPRTRRLLEGAVSPPLEPSLPA
jgi:2-phospho-L-lactate guanylyltransferase